MNIFSLKDKLVRTFRKDGQGNVIEKSKFVPNDTAKFHDLAEHGKAVGELLKAAEVNLEFPKAKPAETYHADCA